VVGLCFWIICNAVQFRVFNRAELSAFNWLFNWHVLPLSLLAAAELVALVSHSAMVNFGQLWSAIASQRQTQSTTSAAVSFSCSVSVF
jgi:ABC-type sulfate transport system permease component